MSGSTSALRSNGIHAVVNLDGEGGADSYDINLIGGRTASLVNVFDTGDKGDGNDALTTIGTDYPDVFLMRSSTGTNGLAFIALINGPTPLTPAATDPVERVNYNSNLESITVNGGNGDDQFYIDDTRSSITVNGGQGNDSFQVGQLYRSRRTPTLAGIAPEDVFATIDTTQGWLSNGVSFPMTINGGIGDDSFIVFHNLDTLNLNGDAGNDNFLVQAFALAGSQEDHRALTDLSGGAGADLIKYAVNAPVNIDGGDGFDTVVVIGTEFNDDFVITPNGVFGAGLSVNFVHIEALDVDGGAGNDRFFILGTNPNWTTTVTGGLGSDLFSVQGPTPGNGVISKDLLGHSGIITHGVESSIIGSIYSGINVQGISAHVGDNDTPGVVVIPTDGSNQVVQGNGTTFSETDQTLDKFYVVLTRAPEVAVNVTVTPPPGLALYNGSVLLRAINSETQVLKLRNLFAGHFTLTFDGATTGALAFDAPACDGVTCSTASVQGALEALFNVGGGNVHVEQTGAVYTITFKGALAHVNVAQLVVTLQGDANSHASATVQTTVLGGVSTPTATTLAFNSANWWMPQPVVFGVDDKAATVPTSADFLNAIAVTPLSGVVAAGTQSVDPNPNTAGDEYATLISSGHAFAGYLPSSSLPEGLRGASLKITAGDEDAAGQVAMVLGSYVENLTINATSGTFNIGFGASATLTEAYNVTATALQNALAGLPGAGAGNVLVTSASAGHYVITLLGTLYLSNAQQFRFDGTLLVGGSGSSLTIDDNSLKLNQAWAVQPTPTKAIFEVGLYTDVKVPGVKVRIFPAAKPSVVVVESGGATNVAVGDPGVGTNNDDVKVRLSAAPASDVTVTLDDGGANLLAFDYPQLTFTASNWNIFQTVSVRAAADDQVVRGFHKSDLRARVTDLANSGRYADYTTTVSVADDNVPGVRVIETDGSTNVIEFT
ncbi:MAG: hypothetical protein E6J51_10410, partial [Chloroflexi bacterium]